MPNADIMQQALEIARAQAGVRAMTAAEVAAYVSELTQTLESAMCPEEAKQTPAVDPKNSIGESYVTCLECGKTFKVITKKHLILHGLDAASYRAKWGFKKGTPLTCKELQRARRQKMKDMKLWEKRAMAREAAAK